MRRTAQRTTGSSQRPAALLSIGLAALILTGCATQVAGTALTPSSISSSSSPSTIASTSTTVPSTDEPSTSGEPSSSDLPSSSDQPSGTAQTSATSSSDQTSRSTTESPTSDEGSASSAASVNPAAFAAKLKAANAGVKTLKGSIAVTAASVKVTGTFGETVSRGQVDALDMSMFISEGSNDVPLRMLIVGGKVYIGGTELLKSLGAGTKKWALASANSKNSNLRTLAAQLDGYLTTASANQYELYATAAKSIVDVGPERIGAVAAHRYAVTVDVAALAKASPPSTPASMEALAKAGVTTLPATLWLDPSGRLVQSESTVKVSGVTSRSTFKVTGYNVAVTIKAPAAADVFAG